MNTNDAPGDGQDIVLRLRPLPDTVPVAVRLRALLKTALRRDRLRCVGLSGAPAASPGEKPLKGNTSGV